MATVAKVTYEDGTSDEVRLKPKDMIAAERHFKGTVPPMEGTFYAVWNKLGRPGSFDSWLDKVDEIDQVDEGSDPFETAPGDEPSQS
jgi:hypothetical protein